MKRIIFIVLAGSLLAAGCTTTPDRAENTTGASGSWTLPNMSASETEFDSWWTVLGDPQLNSIAERAGEVSDVAFAQARLMEARARLSRARSAMRPEIAISGRTERLDVGVFEQEALQSLVNYTLNPDLNGALRSRTEAERFRLQSQAAQIEAVRIGARLTAVQLYSAIYEADARARSGDKSVAALENTLEITLARQRAGLTSALDTVSVRSALSAARVRPAAARQSGAEARLGLEALLGLEPRGLSLLEDQPGTKEISSPRLEVLSAPAAVLARRPELRAAELELWAAGADLEAAKRDFWPTLSLAAALGAQNIHPEQPFTASGFLSQVTLGITAPVFSFGRLSSAQDAADARRLQAQIRYRQAAVDALIGVERAIVALASAEERTMTLSQALNAAQEQVSLASHRYNAGLSSIDSVLAAENGAAELEAALAVARSDRLVSFARFNAEVGLGGLHTLHGAASASSTATP